MTILKCRSVGNSQGVILPSLVREQLNLKKDSLVSAAVIDGALVLRPVSARTAAVIERSHDLMDKHADALQETWDD